MANSVGKIVELSPSLKFVWRIENFSKLKGEDKEEMEFGFASDVFVLGGSKWRMTYYRKGWYEREYINIYLHYADPNVQHDNYEQYEIVSIAIVDQFDYKNTVKKVRLYKPYKKDPCMGFEYLIRGTELNCPDKGYVVDDTCIFIVKFSSSSVKKENLTSEVSLQATLEAQSTQAYPFAGLPFEGFKNQGLGFDTEKYEDVGGFDVLKQYAPLYKLIWSKYGHFTASPVTLTMPYVGQVWLVTDILNAVEEMRQCRLDDVQAGWISQWEDKIKMAESLEINIDWLRKQFEDVKTGFNGMQKFEAAPLPEQGQSLSELKLRMIEAKDEVINAQARLARATDTLLLSLSGLLTESEIEKYLELEDKFLLEGM